MSLPETRPEDIVPGARINAIAHSHPPDDEYLHEGHPSADGPETRRALYSDFSGHFVRFTCNDEIMVAFQGMQTAHWGYLSGSLNIDADWDPESPWVEGEMVMNMAAGQVIQTHYRLLDVDDPDCPYQAEVNDATIGSGAVLVIGRVKIPNRANVQRAGAIPRRYVRVGPR